MPITTDLRLPGVYFLPPPRAAGLGFPPLDVAAFVGFAERGPCHLPVAVEDLNIYRAVFGGELPLARDDAGQTVYANLPRSVAGFLANGGRRCYVVRVAGDEAKSARFQLSGLVALGDTDSVKRASLSASSVGRWAAKLGLTTRLQVTPLPSPVFKVQDGDKLIWQIGGDSQTLQTGDLLRLTFTDDEQMLFPITTVQYPVEAMGSAILEAKSIWPVVTTIPASPPSVVEEAWRLTLTGAEALPSGGLLGLNNNQLIFELTGLTPDDVQRGDILRLNLDDGLTYLFPVVERRLVSDSVSPPGAELTLFATEMLGLNPTALPNTPLHRVDRLRFDLLLRETETQHPTLRELAFNAGHRRFWGEVSLLESSPLYQPAAVETAGSAGPQTEATPAARAARLFQEWQLDRRGETAQGGSLDVVALAGLLAPLETEETALTYLPLGMAPLVTEDSFTGPAQNETGDDDLTTFEPKLFVDRYLFPAPLNPGSTESARTLQAAASDRYYIQNTRLRGLHSLFFVNEVALVSVPDLVHRPWQSIEAEPAAQPIPLPSPPALPPPCPPVGPPFAVCRTLAETTQDNSDASPDDSGSPQEATLPSLPLLRPLDEFQVKGLIAIQQAILSFCQARSDVVGILTLPRHFEKQECLTWQQALRQQLRLPSRGAVPDEVRDIADLSYVAVYHPWLLVTDSEAADRLRAVPCDGAVCGLIASREQQRYVWVAPANMPLQEVLGVIPDLSSDDWAELFKRHFNLIRPEAFDFRAMSAHTLSDEQALLQLSVRRLMILLRKLAIERGMDFVFESNHDRFRQGVRVMLTELLQFMYERGAFAGATAGQAFRVITDTSVNTPQSIDQGRFIVQIQVAPSQPLEFMTVQLVRTGQGLLLTTEG